MNSSRASVCCLACLIALSVPLVATPAPIPAVAALAGSAGAFELRPGVIVDSTAEVLYLMNPDGGIDAVALESGDLLWTTREADKPLGLYGDLLIAQADQPDPEGALEIAFLDTRRRGESRFTIPIELPAEAWRRVDDGMGRSIDVTAAVREGAPWISWEYTKRYVGGPTPGPDEKLETRQSAVYRLDLANERAVAEAGTRPRAAPRALPPGARAWEASGQASTLVSRAGSVLASTQVVRGDGPERVMLKRWDAGSGRPLPDLELFRRPHVVQLPSEDGRSLLIAERVRPGRATEYRWSVFSLETGEELGRVDHARSAARFCVVNGTLVRVDWPSARRVGDQLVEEALQLRGIRLGSPAAGWQRPLRDTLYRGPLPP